MELRGKPVADQITAQVKQDVQALQEKGVWPKLTIIRVGEKPDDLSYERVACSRMQQCGILTEEIALAADCSQETFIAALQEKNNDPSVHGILLLRPLPPALSGMEEMLAPQKDVDCATATALGRMFAEDPGAFAPCTAQAVMEMLAYYEVPLRGMDVTVIGASLVVGKPLSELLTTADATVTTCHLQTRDVAKHTRQADIVISAAGCPGLIQPDMLRRGVVVIDVGINVRADGSICGDANILSCEQVASKITPVPGGVGSVTTSVLAKHVVQAAWQNSFPTK